MGYEYKVVAAPEKCRKHKGAKTPGERAARELQELIRSEAVAGWEYYRIDSFPVTERRGALSRPVEAVRAVVVFRREAARFEERITDIGVPPIGRAQD